MRQPEKRIWGLLRKNAGLFFLLFPVTFVLLVYVAYPQVQIVAQSFLRDGKPTLSNYLAFMDFNNTSNIEALWGSIYISILTVVFSALVGIPLAYLFSFFEFPAKRLFAAIAILPIVMPPLVGVLAFLFLFGESGILPRALQALLGLDEPPFGLDGVAAILVVHIYTMYVYFYLFCSNFFQRLDVSLLEAARNLGAGRWKMLSKIVLPMMTPALGGAALLVFMTSMASFSAPFIFAGSFRVLSLEIYNTKLNGDLEMAVTQSVLLAAISIAFLVLLRKYSERRHYVGGSKGVTVQARPIASGVRRALMAAFGIGLVIVMILPHLTVILMSFVQNGTWTWQTLPPAYTMENYTSLFEDPRIVEPVLNSLKMATIATVCNVIFGIAVAYLLTRYRFIGRKWVEAITMLPWAIPGTVLALSLIITFNRPSWLSAGHILVGSFWILPIAYFIRNIPLVFRSTFATFEQFDPALEESARNLGSNWWLAFRKIILPLIAPGIISGSLLAFVLALGEFVSSILLYNFDNRPISVEIVSQLRIFNLGSAAAYSVFLILLIALVVWLSNRYLGKRTGQVGFVG